MLLGLKEELGIDTALIPRIATPFGGGMGRRGALCGVVSGALMALGILTGRDTAAASTDPAFEATASLLDGFREKFGSIDCRDLTGFDLTSRAELKAFYRTKVKEKRCSLFMGWALDEISRHLPPGPG